MFQHIFYLTSYFIISLRYFFQKTYNNLQVTNCVNYICPRFVI